MGKTKIAVIGLGKISQDQHLPVIQASRSFELAAVVSQRSLTHDGLPTFKTVQELFQERPDIEAVAVNTPPENRHLIARAALDAGKDVLLEKPPAATLAEIADLESRAMARERVLFATWHSRFNDAVDTTRQLLADQGVASLRIEWREDVKKWHPGQAWIWEPGGFGVFDPGINALSILVDILPFEVAVREAMLTYPANRQTPIAARLKFSSLDGVSRLSADFDWREQGDEIWHILIETKDGQKIRLFEGGAALAVGDAVVVNQPREEYQRIYERFAKLVTGRRSDVDIRPLRLVADAMMIGRRETTDPFAW